MKRFVRLTLRLAMLLAFVAVLGFSQEKEGGEESGSLQIWRWANFLVLAGGLGYLIGKNAPSFFAARSQQIGRDMAEARRESEAAEQRSAEVERRLANLETEIASLRARAQEEGQVESERLAQHTAAEIARVQARAEQEIVSAGKAARLELKRHAAELAIGLAEQKIRARLNPETQDALVRGFVRDLK